jgi:UV DNA damage endonuclease
MVKRTFATKGISYASELALKNVIDLERVIDWNIHNGMLFYRMSSDMFPWMSEYELEDLPDFQHIALILKRIGEKAYRHKLRLTYHPGAFNVLATNNETVLNKTIKELRQHGEIMDMIGLPRSPYAKINIHIGGAYGDKVSAIQRFVKNVSLLPITASNRLTVENDDKANMFSVSDLTEVYQATGIPIVFDYHHHQFCTGGLTEEEAIVMAISTWPKDIIPVVHYSSSKKIFEDAASPGPAHADYVYESINTYGLDVDIMLEAKAKEMAVLKFKKDYTSQ